MRLLARREHSRWELAAKLRAGSGAAEKLESLLDRLEQLGYLSDERFAENLVRRRASAWGRDRIGRELAKRGVADQLAAEVMDRMLSVGATEEERALAVLQKKQRTPITRHSKEYARNQRFLRSRGFSEAVIKSAFARHAEALENDDRPG